MKVAIWYRDKDIRRESLLGLEISDNDILLKIKAAGFLENIFKEKVFKV